MKKAISILIISFLMPFISKGQRQQNLPYYYNPGIDSLLNKKFEYPQPRIYTDTLAKFKPDTSIFVGIGSFKGIDSTTITQGNGIFFFTPKPDTTACIMLVSDTSLREYELTQYPWLTYRTYKDFDYSVKWRFGYFIAPLNPNWWEKRGEYLDENKRPLPNNIIVWMSQPAK